MRRDKSDSVGAGRRWFCLAVFAAWASLTIAVPPAGAATIVQHTVGDMIGTFVPGQSVTIPVGGPFNNLTFNWYTPNLRPTASGTLFILSQQYLGTPAALSGSTPGLIAQSQGITAGQYVFDPGVTLQSNVQYFFYANQVMTTSGIGTGFYAGGNAYGAVDASTSFVNLTTQDANFLLAGNPVPEPSSLVMSGIGPCSRSPAWSVV